MIDLLHILFMAAATSLCYGFIHILQFCYHELTYPLVPGPKNPSWIFGNLQEIGNKTDATRKWQEEFGPVYLFRGVFCRRRLVPVTVSFRTRVLGEGLLTVGGNDHKRQRRILNQAFSAPQIRFLTDIFVKKAVQLRDIWAVELTKGNSVTPRRMDIYDGITRTALDVIGQAGFNHNFNALADIGKPNKLESLTKLMHSPNAKIFTELQTLIPAFKLLPLPGQKAMATAHAAMHSIASHIVSQSKRTILALGDGGKILR
ncbi:hypothetical protein MSAN_00843900 [Mycena sanguinolenta]|uniref:Cytochrome P450 n=1 Tax=Mycena sanguinolenta TaxID=230812 RepID=A0A8H7DCG4_9AGAR|nr:hypothetical protein MSAN_00843900 [Mycena sanguinolenta]